MCFFVLVGGLACGPTAVPTDESTEEGRGPGPDIRLPPGDEVEYACADVPEDGVCKDGSAVFCDKRSELIEVKRCTARGLSCDDSDGGARCVDDGGVEEEVDGEIEGSDPNDTGQACGLYDYVGACEGNTLYYCTQQGTLYEHDCSDVAGVCGYSQGAGYYGCLPPAQCDPNADHCAGNAIQICTLGSNGWEVELWDCDADEKCVESGSTASCEARTTSTPTSEPTCAEIGIKGACIDASGKTSAFQEDKLAYCASDGVTIVFEDCSLLGLKCVDPDSSGYVECGEP